MFCPIRLPQVWTLAWAPEIQTISVLADAPTREVLNITTGSDEVLPEVQLVTVSYDDIDEVQTITTWQVRYASRENSHISEGFRKNAL